LAEVEGRMLLSPLLARLPERDRLIINLRFVAGWSQTQIGTLVGASQMQVSRMLARSLAQLRAWSEPESQ
jgi:RNA polymerase sigma-B factor